MNPYYSLYNIVWLFDDQLIAFLILTVFEILLAHIVQGHWMSRTVDLYIMWQVWTILYYYASTCSIWEMGKECRSRIRFCFVTILARITIFYLLT